jgi:thiamine pyrophosphokinase
MAGAVREVLADMAPRIEVAAQDVDDARTALQLALERRNELIVVACDQGMTQHRVATLARIKPPHVIRILAGADQD